MDPAKARDFLGRLGKGGKGAGSGLGVLGAAAALGYGIYKSMYTGKEAGMPAPISKDIDLILHINLELRL